MVTRREFLRQGALTGAGLALGSSRWVPLAYAAVPLDPLLIPKWKTRLPSPPLAPYTLANGVKNYQIAVGQTPWQVLPKGMPTTPVWGYGFGGKFYYPGPTFVEEQGKPVRVTWSNHLGPGSHIVPRDTTLHGTEDDESPRRIVTHLHGGEVEMHSDGYPEAWYTSSRFNPSFDTGLLLKMGVDPGSYPASGYSQYEYPNLQHGATLWYHDHALGQTRLNVYAGMAGFYLLRDAQEKVWIADRFLPSGPYEVGIAIQDRRFGADGSFYLPSTFAPGDSLIPFPPPDPGPAPSPSILAEFAGDVAVVNGVAWPSFKVEPTWYRIRLLNGSDSRFYRLTLRSKGPKGMGLPVNFWQIGTDGGFLPTPVELQMLQLAPGERADLLLNFTGLAGQKFYWYNDADIPFAGNYVDPLNPGVAPLFDILEFQVGDTVNPATLLNTLAQFPTTLPYVEPTHSLDPASVPAENVRTFTLNEGMDPLGRLQPLLNNTLWHAVEHALLSGAPFVQDVNGNAYPTADLQFTRGQTYLIHLDNQTPDYHPIHFHLRMHHVVGRTGAFPGVAPNEKGWKDTSQAPPGTVTDLIIHFPADTYKGLYPWHCHILSHEDHEMMLLFETL